MKRTQLKFVISWYIACWSITHICVEKQELEQNKVLLPAFGKFK